MFDESSANLEGLIYTFRGMKVMLDSDLALLYQLETRSLNQAVKRNLKRFPSDFMFQLTGDEAESLGPKKYSPYVFTENGVAMLSGVLNSDRAISVNIAIMRTFTKLRSFLVMEAANSQKITELEKNTNKLFSVVFERLDDLASPESSLKPFRTKIGIHPQGE
jgi:hypothetical protein